MNHFIHTSAICRLKAVVVTTLLALTTPAAAEVTLAPARVVSALERHALENSPWQAENVEVRLLSFQPVALESSAVNLRVLRPAGVMAPGQQNFLIAAEKDGKEQSRFWVKAEVRIFQEVVVTSQRLLPNEIVTGKDIRLQRRDLSALNGRPFYRLDDVVGQQIARAVAVNETLTQRNLERPTIMRRGNAVMLVYESGALRVETAGSAEENGRAGELIQVKNSASGKLVRGRVLDGRTVRLDR